MRDICAMRMVFLASAGFAAAVCYPLDVGAAWVRQSAFTCAVHDGDAYHTSRHMSTTGGNDAIMCGAPDTSNNKKEDWTAVNVETVRWCNTNIEAKVCATDWNGTSGWCGSYDSTSGSPDGYVQLQPSTTYWTSTYEADFGYVYVKGVLEDVSCTNSVAGIYYGS